MNRPKIHFPKVITITFIVALIALVSCSKEKRFTTYKWDETSCSDPWQTNEFNGIQDFLDSKGIEVKKLEVNFDSSKVQLCEACFCTTGQIFQVQVKEKDEAKMKEIGFYE